jgi:hypothetical protein
MTVINLQKFKLERQDTSAHTGVLVSKPANTGDDRLVLASKDLNKAMQKQGAEMRHYCGVLSNLKSEVARLEASCIRYEKKIKRLSVKSLNRAANRLVRIMNSSQVGETSFDASSTARMARLRSTPQR